MSNPPAQILPCVSRELAHEGYEEILERTRGETRAMREASREYARRHGMPLNHAALVSMLDKGEAIHEIIHEHGASPDLPTARASDLPTPVNVIEAETSPHANKLMFQSDLVLWRTEITLMMFSWVSPISEY